MALALSLFPLLARADTPPLSPYQDLICSYEWSCEQALHIAQCESSMNPNAYAAGNYGLFGINAVHAPDDPSTLYNPAINTAIAWRLYEQGGGWSRSWVYCSSH